MTDTHDYPRRFIRLAAAFVAAALLALPGATAVTGPAFAMDSDPGPAHEETASYGEGKQAIDDGRYQKGVDILKKVVAAEPGNADAWNMLAYGNRKMNRLDTAHEQYMKALAANPEHKGAHECLGELYLQKGDLAKAEATRAKLAAICAGGCKELAELDKQIAAFKAGKANPAWR